MTLVTIAGWLSVIDSETVTDIVSVANEHDRHTSQTEGYGRQQRLWILSEDFALLNSLGQMLQMKEKHLRHSAM